MPSPGGNYGEYRKRITGGDNHRENRRDKIKVIKDSVGSTSILKKGQAPHAQSRPISQG